MDRYVIANAAGEIIRTVICSEDSAAQQARPGETLLADLTATSATHWVNAGVLVPYTTAVAAVKANRPTDSAVWSNATFTWSDPRSLDELKAVKWEALKEARDADAFGTFAWNGLIFQCDQASVSLLQMALSGAQYATQSGQQFQEPWTLADNSIRSLSASDMYGVMQALGAHVAQCYATGRTLRDQVAAATSTSELDAIQWPSS